MKDAKDMTDEELQREIGRILQLGWEADQWSKKGGSRAAAIRLRQRPNG
jgi:hypothetical protein